MRFRKTGLLPAFFFIVFIVSLSCPLLAQELNDNPLFPQPRPKRFFIGPLVGYNSNFHGGGFLTLGGSNIAGNPDCGQFTTGSGNGLILGISAEYWFKKAGNTSLQFDVYYEQKPGSFTSVGGSQELWDTSTNQLVSFTNTRYVKATYNLLNFEVLYKYNIPGLPHFGVSLGPKVGIVMGSSYVQYEQLTPGFAFKLPNGNYQTDTIVNAPNGIPSASGIRFGLKASIQYEALVGPFLFTPAISYDYGITKIVSSWSVSTLAATLAIKYGF